MRKIPLTSALVSFVGIIVVAALGWIITFALAVNAKTDKNALDVMDVRGDIKSINTSIISLNANVSDIKSLLDNKLK